MIQADRKSSVGVAKRFIYLYLSMAYADGNVGTDEKSLIIKLLNFTEQFPSAEAEDILEEVMADLENQNSEERASNLFQMTNDMNLTEAEVTKVLEHLEHIMEADGVIKHSELDLFRRIQVLLKSTLHE